MNNEVPGSLLDSPRWIRKKAPVSRCLNGRPRKGAGPDAKHSGLKGFILFWIFFFFQWTPFDTSAERADKSLSPSSAYHDRGYALEPQCPHRGIAPPRGAALDRRWLRKRSTDFIGASAGTLVVWLVSNAPLSIHLLNAQISHFPPRGQPWTAADYKKKGMWQNEKSFCPHPLFICILR